MNKLLCLTALFACLALATLSAAQDDDKQLPDSDKVADNKFNQRLDEVIRKALSDNRATIEPYKLEPYRTGFTRNLRLFNLTGNSAPSSPDVELFESCRRIASGRGGRRWSDDASQIGSVASSKDQVRQHRAES